MNRMTWGSAACAAVVIAALGVTAGPSLASGTAKTFRVHDRLISVGAPHVSARTVRGLAKVRLGVKVRAVGRRHVPVSASDFAVSAEGDVFAARGWNRARHRVVVRPRRSQRFRLSFAVPKAAMKHAALLYRPARIRDAGAMPLARGPLRDPASPAARATINTFFTAGGAGAPWGTAIDRAGSIWFAEPGCDFETTCSASARPGHIGVIKASSHAVVHYALPNIPGNQPIFLAFDRSGKLWFTTPKNSRIGEFDPSTGTFVGQWRVTAGSGPWDLTFAGGRLWYTEHFASAVGSFDPATRTSHDFPTPSANSNPYGIAANGGLIWFTENNSNVDRVAVLDTTANNTISEFPIVLPMSGTPHLITIDSGGRPWWTEGWTNTIATLDPAAGTAGQCGTPEGTCNGIRRFAAPAPTACVRSGVHTSGIAYQSSAQRVWFDDSLAARVGSFSPSTNTFAMTTLSTCSGHPHDGLSVDGAGNVWFDEEFANAIGQLIPRAAAASLP
jgi:streptogramin lyase